MRRPSRSRRRWLLSAAVAVAAAAGAVRPLSGQAGPSAVLDSLVGRELAARPIAGMVVAVVQDGDTLLLRSYGSADLEHRVPMSRDAVFQIASVTKQFTAAGVLRLVEDGRVHLDDDIRTYLPELDTQGHTVRIRELLNHTAGIPNLYEMTSWPRIRPLRLLRPEAREMEMAGVAEDSLDFPPGSEYHYSNTGYDLLGDMMEEVTGETVERYLRRVLFEPLGLHHTSFCPWKRILPHRAWGYEPDSTLTHLENARRQSQGILFTSGGICSTVGDLLRWNAALHGGTALSGESYAAMTTPEGAAETYGYGLFVDPLEGHPRIRHNGYTPGFSTQLEYYPRDRLSIAILANSPSAVQTLAENLARAVLGMPPGPPPP
jgi:CubicO group peptidase (beta-lactamase class C family)